MQREPKERPRRRSRAQRGFTLIELLVAMVVMAEVMAVAYVLFDVNTRIGRTQIQVTDLQQNQRVAQHDLVRLTRMAGRGYVPQQLAVAVDNNVAANTDIVADSGSPTVVEGTDVLTLRGVFTTPIYQVGVLPGGGSSLVLTTSGSPPMVTVTGGTVIVQQTTGLSMTQSFDALDEIGDPATRPEALILVSPANDAVFAIVEVTGVTIAGNTASIDFEAGPQNRYDSLAPFPIALTAAGAVGIVEEYRYYVREDFSVSGDPTSEPAPKLSRARVYPGSDDVWDGALANASVDIADNVLDLQVALGFDLDRDGRIDENDDDSIDEWRYNHSGDDPNDANWQFQGVPPVPVLHYYTRLITLTRTDRPDRGYQDDPIQAIEDHDYSEPAVPATSAEGLERQFRRRRLQTIVDMRNLG
jgi:prepilin-type N-terminal cleavage/methylation domain-containing protein